MSTPPAQDSKVMISAGELAALREQLAAANAKLAVLQKPEDDDTPLEKTKCYFSHVPFFKFHVIVGPGLLQEYNFVAGRFETKDPRAAKFLDGIVDKPGSGVVSKNPEFVEEEVMTMRRDLETAAVRSHNRMVASGLSTA